MSNNVNVVEIDKQDIDSKDVRSAVRTLRLGGAGAFDGYYWAFVNKEQEQSLEDDKTIANVFDYNVPKDHDNPLVQGSIPAIYGVKFYRTPGIKTAVFVGRPNGQVGPAKLEIHEVDK